jgi:hypothetical protein
MNCSLCGKNDPTVDRNMFDGMCAYCTDKALHNPELAKRAERNNKQLKDPYRDLDSSCGP